MKIKRWDEVQPGDLVSYKAPSSYHSGDFQFLYLTNESPVDQSFLCLFASRIYLWSFILDEIFEPGDFQYSRISPHEVRKYNKSIARSYRIFRNGNRIH